MGTKWITNILFFLRKKDATGLHTLSLIQNMTSSHWRKNWTRTRACCNFMPLSAKRDSSSSQRRCSSSSRLRMTSDAKCSWPIISWPVLSRLTMALLCAATSASNAWCFWILACKKTRDHEALLLSSQLVKAKSMSSWWIGSFGSRILPSNVFWFYSQLDEAASRKINPFYLCVIATSWIKITVAASGDRPSQNRKTMTVRHRKWRLQTCRLVGSL